MTSHSSVVYLVEDDEGARDSTRALLDIMGFNVKQYEAAEDLLEEGLPGNGCVLADLGLPGMTGQQLYRELRKRGSDVPVIMMSGHADSILIDAATEAGVEAFLVKPVAPKQLTALLRDVLARSGEAGSQTKLT